MNCPVCHVELRMGDRLGVELDYCPQCRGVWLEKGKLDRILERSSSAAPRPPQPEPQQSFDRYRDHDHHDHEEHGHEFGQHGRRKKSFLSDLFD